MGWLVADIGGTNTRVALTGADSGVVRIRSFRNHEQAGLADLLAGYLADIEPGERPAEAVFAVAAPPGRDGVVRMSNQEWSFRPAELAARLGLQRIRTMNDFAALAYALPVLGPADLVQIGGGTPVADGARVVLGPGTGLGTAGLIRSGSGWQPVPGEGGHATLPAVDEREIDLICRARAEFGHCSAERLISGPGLTWLHQALHGGAPLDPVEIGRRLTAGDAAARESLMTLFRMLATVASNLAVIFAALGGVYIGGGITPRYLDTLRVSGFRERFEDKGRYRSFVAGIPTWVITAEQPTLRGLAAYAAANP